MKGAAKIIEILAFPLACEFLHLHPEFGGKGSQILMAGVHEQAAELAEHAFVEVVDGEHPSAPTAARFEQNGFRAGGLQTIGGGQPRYAATDDRNRAWLFLPGESASVENRRECGSTGSGRR